jgi:hypothetical protein
VPAPAAEKVREPPGHVLEMLAHARAPMVNVQERLARARENWLAREAAALHLAPAAQARDFRCPLE